LQQVATETPQPPQKKNLAPLDKIGFKWEPNWTDRGIAVGGTGSGKSFLCEHLIEHAIFRYPKLQVLILDSKPRFRAEHETSGVGANRRYSKWDHGTPIPGSYALNLRGSDAGLADALRLGAGIIIAQTTEESEFSRLLDAAQSFYRTARSSQPRLIYVDEVMDFYKVGGHTVGNNALLRAARAGRELGLGLLIASQRPRHIPVQLVQEANKLYLFKLRNTNDVDHLEEFGTPDDLWQHVPNEQRWFYYYDHEDPASQGKYKINP
jgi:hypothetical protein